MGRKSKRNNIRCKRCHYYRPLSLPENIWRQYEKSLIEIESSQPQHNVMPTPEESKTQLCTKNAEKDIVNNREELSLENLMSVNEGQVSIENQTNSEIQKNMNIFTYSDKDMSLSLSLQEMGKEDELKKKESSFNNLFGHISDKEIIDSLNEMESTDDLITSNSQQSHKNIFVPLSGKEILEILEDDSRNICEASLLKNLVGNSKDENETTLKPIDNCIIKKQQKKQLLNNKREKKQKQIIEKQKLKSLMIKQNLEQKNNVFKLLSVKVDNFSTVDLNCLLFNNRLKESIDLHKTIYESMLGAKEILTNCSIRQVIHLKDQNNLFSNHIISADAKLDNTFKLLHKLELLLTNLQQHFHEISIPFSLLDYYNIDNDLQRMTVLLKDKQNEIEILKQKNAYLENELQSSQEKLIKTKRNYKKHISETDKKFSEMKNKLCFFRKRLLRLSVQEDNKKSINNFNPTQYRMQQLQDLMSLANSVMQNMLNDSGKVNLSQNNKETHRNTKMINNLKSEIRDLKKQNKQKDNEIQSLTKAGNRARRQALLIEQKKKIEDEQKRCEINKLNSTLNDLQRKHDRWLLDKFHQKCHSIMLFEKIKQLELQQHKTKET